MTIVDNSEDILRTEMYGWLENFMVSKQTVTNSSLNLVVRTVNSYIRSIISFFKQNSMQFF